MDTLHSDLFSIALEFDDALQIHACSPLLQRKVPGIKVGDSLTDVFQVHRPSASSLRNPATACRSIFLMSSRETKYPIRGQVVPKKDAAGRYQLFGAPWLSRMISDEIHQYDLDDFPLHDGQLDWLMLLSAEQQNVRDLQSLSDSLRASREETEAAASAKSRFFEVMSHEMRTPLNAVIGSLRLMDENPLADSQRELLSMGLSGAEQLLEVINDVLDISKLEAGKMQAEKEPFDLVKLLGDVTAINMPRAIEKGLSLEVETAAEVDGLWQGDPAKLRQVLLNIIGNAIKFTASGSVIVAARLQLAEPNSDTAVIRISVTDTGIGVHKSQRPFLFENFWSGSGPSDDRASGTGLGLEIARQLTELMDGSIDFESEYGQGSCFWVDLPLTKLAAQHSSDADNTVNQSAPIINYQGQQLLLVEDNATNRMLAEMILAGMGFAVSTACGGEEAVAACQNDHFDVVLMDLGLPDISGQDATRQIRGLTLAKQPKIIAFTAHTYSVDDPALLEIGFDACLMKPMDKAQVSELLSS